MPKSNKLSVIIVGAGKGERFSPVKNKITAEMRGKEVFRFSLETMQKSEMVSEIIFVGTLPLKIDVLKMEYPKLMKIVPGGTYREESVWNGLKETNPDARIIMIHDAARPLFPSSFVPALCGAVSINDGAIPVLPMQDALKQMTDTGDVKTFQLSKLYRTQTPQAFRRDLLYKAFQKSEDHLQEYRDETEIVLAYKPRASIKPIPGSYLAEKITSEEDLESLCHHILPSIRSGIGYDFHYFIENKSLILGGCKIEFPKGLEGDSDGDVLCHSILDSMLGALSLGDIGRYIGIKTENAMKAKSLTFLHKLINDPTAPRFSLIHIDVTIVCKEPILNPYIEEMTKNLADALLVSPNRINLKTTSDKGMDSAGEGKGIRVISVATIDLK